MSNTDRTYRLGLRENDLTYFQVVYKETDLHIGVRTDRFSPELAERTDFLVRELRGALERYISEDPLFLRSLEPFTPATAAPEIAHEMAAAARLAGVGPMAAVAGAFAARVGRELGRFSKEVLVENGGDIYLKSTRRRLIGIFAADSPFTGRIALEIPANITPLGICTSSGVVGHSLSLGKADAVVVLAASTALADATATAAANLVTTPAEVDRATDFASQIPGILGVLSIKGDRLAAWGQVKLIPITP
ncbi:MAG: UPF0280 family protein [Eubacteriales bacterium]|nr:UPF0280 family protein [Bacillota bacterium]MBV1727443.1 UPF0280 family protein [Desulforudis sp.]MDP3050734.1 UPF0280 family protein [Eubacteriales bacterium]MDQ7788802.1 UPF0280 family protein [Clostridia bacterium]MBU4532917.1 UPF0280 family protein [Bacillota bacterium]